MERKEMERRGMERKGKERNGKERKNSQHFRDGLCPETLFSKKNEKSYFHDLYNCLFYKLLIDQTFLFLAKGGQGIMKMKVTF